MSTLTDLLAEHGHMILSLNVSQMLDKRSFCMINSNHPFPYRVVVQTKHDTMEGSIIEAIGTLVKAVENNCVPKKSTGLTAEDVL